MKKLEPVFRCLKEEKKQPQPLQPTADMLPPPLQLTADMLPQPLQLTADMLPQPM